MLIKLNQGDRHLVGNNEIKICLLPSKNNTIGGGNESQLHWSYKISTTNIMLNILNFYQIYEIYRDIICSQLTKINI